MNVGVVVIGRNEGERLKRCLKSLPKSAVVVYVDSGSVDESVAWARSHGVDVVDLDMGSPFTAARARNAGSRRLREVAPNLAYMQFVDGDCEIDGDWISSALAFIDTRPDVGAVCGHLRERHPERSVYNWLCEQEWIGPIGEIGASGGNVMMRVAAFDAVGGYRDDVIAAEDDELCVRLRVCGWRIWRIDSAMGLHEANMMHFGQWWRRAVRAGYAFALGAHLHGALPERYFVWESRRAWLFGMWLPLGCLVAGLIFEPWGWAAWLIYPLHTLQKIVRGRGPLRHRAPLALFHVLGHFPQSWGAIKFTLDRLLGRQPHVIEYK